MVFLFYLELKLMERNNIYVRVREERKISRREIRGDFRTHNVYNTCIYILLSYGYFIIFFLFT
jgi:hypothetical protein